MNQIDKNNLTDFEIVTLCQEDNSYFEILVERYKKLIYSVVYKMTSDVEESKDLTQEIFIKIYKNLYKYSTDYKFSTWIIKISTNHVIDYRRKQHYTTTEYNVQIHDELTVVSAEDQFLQKEHSSDMTIVMNKLPEDFRIPIVLYHKEGLSYQEISDVLDIPLSKVKNRIFKGRKLLKDLIQESNI